MWILFDNSCLCQTNAYGVFCIIRVLCVPSLLYWGFVVFVPNNRQWSGWDLRPRLTPPSYQSQRFQDKLEFSEIFLQCLIKSPPNLADPTKTINLLCQDIWISNVWFWLHKRRLVWGQIIFSGWKNITCVLPFLTCWFHGHWQCWTLIYENINKSKKYWIFTCLKKMGNMRWFVFQMRELWKEWTRWNASSPER